MNIILMGCEYVGKSGSFSDPCVRSRGWDRELLKLAPETLLILMKASPEVILSRMKRYRGLVVYKKMKMCLR